MKFPETQSAGDPLVSFLVSGNMDTGQDGGKLGHGDEQDQLLPKKIEAFAGQRVVAVSGGTAHNLARTADGPVFTWGQGEYGCLGHGEDLSNQLLPKKIEAWALEQ